MGWGGEEPCARQCEQGGGHRAGAGAAARLARHQALQLQPQLHSAAALTPRHTKPRAPHLGGGGGPDLGHRRAVGDGQRHRVPRQRQQRPVGQRLWERKRAQAWRASGCGAPGRRAAAADQRLAATQRARQGAAGSRAAAGREAAGSGTSRAGALTTHSWPAPSGGTRKLPNTPSLDTLGAASSCASPAAPSSPATASGRKPSSSRDRRSVVRLAAGSALALAAASPSSSAACVRRGGGWGGPPAGSQVGRSRGTAEAAVAGAGLQRQARASPGWLPPCRQAALGGAPAWRARRRSPPPPAPSWPPPQCPPCAGTPGPAGRSRAGVA